MLFSLLALSVSGDEWFENFRECPTGYTYIGDDGTPDNSLEGSYWYLGESPTYSCYKSVAVTDINDALGQCYKSVMDSDQMEARVVSFDDEKEVYRVFNNYYDLSNAEVENAKAIMTSGMKFAVQKNETKWTWIYLGTNYTISSEDIKYKDIAEKQCLRVKATFINKTENLDEQYTYEWAAVPCMEPMDSLCEIRVQTVTYAWVPNWLSITLIILTIILMVTCCMAALSYTKYKPNTTRAYRANGSSNQNTTNNNYPANDLPPKYSDVTGISVVESQQSALDKYKNKGKEMLAKIYVVRDS